MAQVAPIVFNSASCIKRSNTRFELSLEGNTLTSASHGNVILQCHTVMGSWKRQIFEFHFIIYAVHLIMVFRHKRIVITEFHQRHCPLLSSDLRQTVLRGTKSFLSSCSMPYLSPCRSPFLLLKHFRFFLKNFTFFLDV